MSGRKSGPHAQSDPVHPMGGAFTLVELLVVLGVIGILAGMILPALARSKAKSQGIFCLSNTKQLLLATVLYAGDNNERIVYNLGGSRAQPIPRKLLEVNWVNNIMNWEVDPDNTNTAFVGKSPLGQHVSLAARVFKCPADRALSAIQKRAGWTGRVRSISMNAMVGDAGPNVKDRSNLLNPGYRQFLNTSDFENPSHIFVFLDEHPDSINDGYFLNNSEESEWTDLPASNHDGAASFSFADGHSELHRWTFNTTKPPAKPDAAPLPMPVPQSERADFDWVIDRTSVEH